MEGGNAEARRAAPTEAPGWLVGCASVCVGAPWAFRESRAGGWGAAVAPVRSAVS